MYYIYEVTNKINGKKYIGKHISEDIENDNYIGSGKLLLKAIEKYGQNNFKRIILQKCNSLKELNEQEIYWIQLTDAVNSKNYYNLARGGDGGAITKQYIWIYNKNTEDRRLICPTDIIPNGFDAVGPTKDTFWVHDNQNNTMMLPKGSIVPDGFTKGRGPAKNKNTFWIHNPLTNEKRMIHKCEKIPDGWIKGKGGNPHLKNKKYYTDGNTVILVDITKNPPKGFKVGTNRKAGRYYRNPVTNEVKKFYNDEEIPKDFIPSGPDKPNKHKMKWYYNPKTMQTIYIQYKQLPPKGFIPGRGKLLWYHNPKTKQRIRLSLNQKPPRGFIKGKGSF